MTDDTEDANEARWRNGAGLRWDPDIRTWRLTVRQDGQDVTHDYENRPLLFTRDGFVAWLLPYVSEEDATELTNWAMSHYVGQFATDEA